jgi:probable addiction module antidote protein
MKVTIDYKEHLIHKLKDPDYALGYLNECLKDEDDNVFLLGLRYVAEAHGGIRKIAEKAHLNREHLFRMLSKKGNPRLESLREIAQALGWRFALVPYSEQKRRKAA